MSDSEQPASERGREQAVDRLCQAFAEDALEVDEFEMRIEMAHRAETAEQLRVLLADLPSSASTSVAAAGASNRPAPLPSEDRLEGLHVPRTALIMGVLGGASRKGRWIPARKTNAIGLMGGVELDMREAVLAPGVTEIHCFAIWGGIEVVVPPGVAVECDGVGILGGFEQRHETELLTDPDSPVIRIRGIALMGGVEVTSRYAGESARDARRRLREEKKEQRKRLRGG